jgi:hypothetical protein
LKVLGIVVDVEDSGFEEGPCERTHSRREEASIGTGLVDIVENDDNRALIGTGTLSLKGMQ